MRVKQNFEMFINWPFHAACTDYMLQLDLRKLLYFTYWIISGVFHFICQKLWDKTLFHSTRCLYQLKQLQNYASIYYFQFLQIQLINKMKINFVLTHNKSCIIALIQCYSSVLFFASMFSMTLLAFWYKMSRSDVGVVLLRDIA